MLEQLFHHPAPHNRFSLQVAARAVGGAFVLLALLSTIGAQAQSGVSTERPTLERHRSSETAAWRTHFDDQVVPVLTQSDADARTRALLTILDVARHRDEARLAATVPVLFDVYAADPDPQNRILAARTLHALVNHRSDYGAGVINTLHEAVQREPSEHVRRVTLALMATYHREQGQTLAVPTDVYLTTLAS